MTSHNFQILPMATRIQQMVKDDIQCNSCLIMRTVHCRLRRLHRQTRGGNNALKHNSRKCPTNYTTAALCNIHTSRQRNDYQKT